MQVTTEQLDPCKIEMKIEVEEEKVTQTRSQVFKEIAKGTEIPGFRKGKAPRAMLERFVSPEMVKRHTIERLLPEAYMEALKQEEIVPFSEPDVEIEQFEETKPLIFKATVPLPPKVELGEYKGIEAEKNVKEITDEDVDAQLEYLRESRATMEKVEDRGLKEGDIAVAEISSATEGEERSEPERSLIELGRNIPGFDENVIGMTIDEEKTFTINYPEEMDEEHKNLAGKPVEFTVKLESIRERQIPDLDDEFAKSVGQENLDELKKDIRKHIIESADNTAERDLEVELIDKIVEKSEISFPDIILDSEIEHEIKRLTEMVEKQGLTMEKYLEEIGKTYDNLKEEIKEIAAKRIKRGLTLGEIAEKENIVVADEDVEAEVETMAEETKSPVEAVDAYLESSGGREALKDKMLNKKVFDAIKSVSVIKKSGEQGA